MDFELTQAQLDLRARTRDFVARELAPGVESRYREHHTPHEVFHKLGAQGLLGVNIPKDLGGAALGPVAFAIALREIAAVDASTAVTAAVSNMVAEVINQFGTPEQKAEHVTRIASGEYYGGAFALSEPGAGSDAASLKTKAVRTGGGYLLNGEKMWITTGDDAGVVVVWARSDAAKTGHHGITCFLVGKDTPGLTAGKPEEKMGLMASHTVSLSLADVEVPKSAVLGHLGEGFRIAMTALDGGRISIGSQSAGLASGALTLACAYAKTAKHQGRPLAEQQGIQFKLADTKTALDASWLLTLRAAWLKQQGQRFSGEAAMAKVFASEAANRAVRQAVDIMGVYGYAAEKTAQRLFRDCRVTQIYEGTSEVQRLVIARQVLQ